MTLNNGFFLLGGLGLFLYGMNLMSEGLNLIAGDGLKNILYRLTRNKWVGAFFGFIVTAIIQSSTATTVMVIGLIDSSLMSLNQATSVIMGANAGTTLAGVLFTFNIQDIVPFIIFIGTIFTLFINRKSFKHTGMIILGFGILFLGLNLMTTSMIPLRDSAIMTEIFMHTQMPLVGLLVGFIVTAIIQSSTASLGILLAMVTAGIVVNVDQAVYILYGFNIGTVLTTLISALKANRTAKQGAVVHILFNFIGALFFTLITVLPLGFTFLIQSLSDNISLQLVYTHIIFNISTMIILLPFSQQIVQVSQKIIKDNSSKKNRLDFKFINKGFIFTPEVEIQHVTKEVNRMFELVIKNCELLTDSISEEHLNVGDKLGDFFQNEKIIYYLKEEILKFLINFNTTKLKETDIINIGILYRTVNYLSLIEHLSSNMVLSIKQHETINGNFEKNKNVITLLMNPMIILVKKSLYKTYDLFKETGKTRKDKLIDDIYNLQEDILHLTKINSESLRTEITYTTIINNLRQISIYLTEIAKAIKYKKIY